MLLLLFSPPLGAAAGSNTLGVGTAIAVSTWAGGENILESCFIASFTIVPCCNNGVLCDRIDVLCTSSARCVVPLYAPGFGAGVIGAVTCLFFNQSASSHTKYD